jgi:hypothetical protein
MAITLQDFVSGDTDYISKMNANDATIAAAINSLQSAIVGMSGGAGSSATVAAFLDALFGSVTTLIGAYSYKPTGSGSDLTVAPGACYRASSLTVVQSIAPVVLSFTGLTAGTYYIAVDAIGSPIRLGVVDANQLYTVVWSGSAFSTITRVVKALYNATEEDDGRKSTEVGVDYPTLDIRLEGIEETAGVAATAAGIATADAAAASAAAATALANAATAQGRADDAYDLAAAAGGAPAAIYRKVGVSLDGGGAVISAGEKGIIQVDFNGTIVGWSIVGDFAGSISVEVSLKRSSPPTAPPSAPLIPIDADKISASAPIVLSTAQSAAVGTSGVSTWATAIQQWDVLRFKVTATATLITRATLYLRILETP